MLNQLVIDLVGAGLSEQDISDRLADNGVKAAQSTINRIKSGDIENPRYELGSALIELHREVCKSKGRPAKPQEARP